MSAETTPSDTLPKTLEDLGWGQLLGHLARRAHTDRGAAILAELPFLDGPEQATARMAEIAEARRLADLDAALPFGGISDVRTAIGRAQKGGALEPEDLVAVARAAEGAVRLGQHLQRHAEEAPALAVIAEAIADLGHVFYPILESFEPDGTLSDHASNTLGGLRKHVAQLKSKLEHTAERLVDDSRYEKHLQDHYFTQRDDRYVLPIKVESKGWVKGIVHGTSQSGHTVFIEPEEIVDLNNSLKLAECEVADEERRILAMLTSYVAEDADAIGAALEVATQLDVVAAGARFSADLGAAAAEIDPAGRLDLERARHPLMVASARHCVPNDIVLRPRSVLVISGPNAGGKTVALKTAGLCALMIRAGLHVPAASGSRVPWYRAVMSDIGDAQSIDKDLSTFSAHLIELGRFLREADADTLLLVDEIAVGTEPEQGAALARAVLEALADRGIPTIVTTHYESLKALAAGDDRFDNASVGYDLDKMEPTFRLHLGAPGSSGALRVARRMGLPEPVLARAQEVLGEGRASIEEIMASLESSRRELAAEREAAEKERLRYEAARLAADSAKSAADERRRRLHEQMYDGALDALRRAREEIDEMKTRLRRRRRVDDLQAASARLDEVGADVARSAPERPAPPGRPARLDELVAGARVWVVSLGGEGVVVGPPERGSVQLQVGALKTAAPVDGLRVLPPRPTRPSRPPAPAPRPPPRRPEPRPGDGEGDDDDIARTPQAVVDVRGERVDEAVSDVDRFLDESLRAERELVFVIHGRGTGALRRAVQELMKGHPAVLRFRNGQPREGGDGVTVAWLDVA